MPFTGNHTLPTNLGDCEGLLYCIATWAEDVTGGFFWAAILGAFIVVIYMGSQRFGTARAFGFSSMTGLLASIFLVTLQLIPYWIASLFILIGIAGFAVMILSER